MRQMPEVLREGGRPKKLLTLVREAIRRRHVSGRTEESRVSRARRYIYCHGKRHGGRHPAMMGEPATERKIRGLHGHVGRRVEPGLRRRVP